MHNKLNVLLIGGGGREHALAWKISQSPMIKHFYSINGSDAIGHFAILKHLDWKNPSAILLFCQQKLIDLVVIGPEKPINEGLSDYLTSHKINVFAPSKIAAQIETSKAFTKKLCDDNNMPTAQYKVFTDITETKNYLDLQNTFPIVIKYDGLAEGKGVIIAQNIHEAIDAVNKLYSSYKNADFKLVIEDFLEGRELSFFAISDGKTVQPLAFAQDYKRAYDGDKGDNTGGMGAISGNFLANKELQATIMEKVIHPLLDGLKRKGITYKGIIFAGLMIDKNNQPMIIEFNARWGDPETETICMRMESDLLQMLYFAATKRLSEIKIKMSSKTSICVVYASNGYPAAYKKGSLIENIPEDSEDVKIFHHGTKIDENNIVKSNGGRVLSANAIGENLEEACAKAYAAMEKIKWEDGFYRKDIGK